MFLFGIFTGSVFGTSFYILVCGARGMTLEGGTNYRLLAVPRAFVSEDKKAGLWPVARVGSFFRSRDALEQSRAGAIAYFSFSRESKEEAVSDVDRLLGTFQDYRKHLSEEDVYVKTVKPVLGRIASRIRNVTVRSADGVEKGRAWVSDEKMSVIVGTGRCSVDIGPGRETVLSIVRGNADRLARVTYREGVGADMVVGSTHLFGFEDFSGVNTVFLPAMEDYISRVGEEVSNWANRMMYAYMLRVCDYWYDQDKQKGIYTCNTDCGTVQFVLEDEE